MSIEEKVIRIIVTVIISYLLGSTPTAYVIARLKNVNIFEVGSGNMGGTNVVRAIGLGWGVLTGLIDVSKGALSVFLALQIMPGAGVSDTSRASAITIAAIVAIIGHNWSLFAALITATFSNGKVRLVLRGGKGAATSFGTLLFIAPAQVIVGMLLLGGLILALTRYVSLSVLIAFGVTSLWLFILVGTHELQPQFALYSAAIVAMIIFRHRDNIQRLLTGTERRIGERI